VDVCVCVCACVCVYAYAICVFMTPGKVGMHVLPFSEDVCVCVCVCVFKGQLGRGFRLLMASKVWAMVPN